MISVIKIKPGDTKSIINKFNNGLDIIGAGSNSANSFGSLSRLDSLAEKLIRS